MSGHKVRILNLCLPLLLALVLPAGCGEGSYGPPRKAQSVHDGQSAVPEPPEQAQAKPGEPMLVVGDVTMPMPVPAGFRRIPGEHPLTRLVRNSLDPDETLLCLFERVEADADDRAASADPENLAQLELLHVSTLSKWLDLELSSLDFLKIKQPWQDDSIEFTQNVLNEFAAAARGDLSPEREFSYDMGMIDSSPLHISFLRMEKHTALSGVSGYVCGTTSLVWRYGKILRVTYSKPIEKFEQIHGVVAESVGYVQKLQAIDRNTRLSSIYGSDPASAQNSPRHSSASRSL